MTQQNAPSGSGTSEKKPRTFRRFVAVLAVFGLMAAVGPAAVDAYGSDTVQATAAQRGEIQRLYHAFFQRTPDAGGAAYWENHRARGASLPDIASEFAKSPEFRARYGALDDAAFVELVYRNVLNRAPDATGAEHWRARLAEGTSRGTIMTHFSESPEFLRSQSWQKVAPAPAKPPTGGSGGGGGGGSTPAPKPPVTTTKPPVTTAPPTTARPPVTTRPPATTTPPTTVRPPAPTNPGHGGPAIDESRIPAPAAGNSGMRIGPANYSRFRQPNDPTGAFRTSCTLSHMNFDDPIVFPGVRRATHLHAFYGNTIVDAASTATSIRTTGNSTCTGGFANRSAYWAPAVIDTRTGAPVLPGTSQTDREHALQVYYKTGYDGVLPGTIQNFPQGLRMVAGTASSSSPQPANVVRFSCDNGTSSASFPNCAPGQLFVMSIAFPQCWDGRNLDSPNHKSHMAYGAGWPDRGCPSSHPVPLAQITQNFRFRVPAGGMSSWRLASDMYNGPAGYSAHADWMNGWDAPTFQRVIDNCFRGGYDCSMNLLGDGQALY